MVDERFDHRLRPVLTARGTGTCLALTTVVGLSSCGVGLQPADSGTPVTTVSTSTNTAAAADTVASQPPVEVMTRSPSPARLERLAGGVVMTGISRASAPTSSQLRMAERGEIGGVIIVDTSMIDARPAVRALQRAARRGGNPPLIVAVDQEGGRVRRFAGFGPASSALELGDQSPAAAAREARVAGCALRRSGVTLDLAPVTDVAVNSSGFLAATGRSFGARVQIVGPRAAAFTTGLQAGGVGATLKHFPGLGAAGMTTDDSLAERLGDPGDLAAFAIALEARPLAVMVSSATYDTGRFRAAVPAFANPSVSGWLRRRGFDGVVMSDDLATAAVRGDRRLSSPAVAALRGGVDLLVSVDPTGAYAARMHGDLLAAAHSGELPRSRLDEAWQRLAVLRTRQRVLAEHAACA